jgi:hypothetical protein
MAEKNLITRLRLISPILESVHYASGFSYSYNVWSDPWHPISYTSTKVSTETG